MDKKQDPTTGSLQETHVSLKDTCRLTERGQKSYPTQTVTKRETKVINNEKK
jgi:hypothetical protein